MRNASLSTLIVAAATLLGAATCLPAQQEGPLPTTATIHVDAKGRPVDASMLTLQLKGKTVPIDSLTPAAPQGIELAILIDDGLRHSFALQLRDIADFVAGLPPSVKVMVGYMQNGTVAAKEGFTADHERLQKEIRIPLSAPGLSASPYICLSDFVEHWPSQQRSTRVVLMLTNGVDPYNGSTSVLNQDSPYVRTAAEDAQRAGVAVYAIYYGDAGIGGGSANFSGQSYLNQLTGATGGDSLWQGTSNPVSLSPFLKEFGKDLNESYLIGFQAGATRDRDGLVPLKVKSNVSGVKVHAPDAVRPGLND